MPRGRPPGSRNKQPALEEAVGQASAEAFLNSTFEYLDYLVLRAVIVNTTNFYKASASEAGNPPLPLSYDEITDSADPYGMLPPATEPVYPRELVTDVAEAFLMLANKAFPHLARIGLAGELEVRVADVFAKANKIKAHSRFAPASKNARMVFSGIEDIEDNNPALAGELYRALGSRRVLSVLNFVVDKHVDALEKKL
ncbi:hypothetical protein HYU40_02765 [Candidatus Woesearchaeota archaeon]|nr:hypothetical protein [Candidatus Woesearchaeota archaeon]